MEYGGSESYIPESLYALWMGMGMGEGDNFSIKSVKYMRLNIVSHIFWYMSKNLGLAQPFLEFQSTIPHSNSDETN